MSDEALRKLERARATGDLAAHAAIKAYRERKGMPAEIPRELASGDWDEAFGVAGDELVTTVRDGVVFLDTPYRSKYNGADIRPARESAVSLAPFDRRDIKRVLAHWERDSDGWSGEVLMELRDGRYAYLVAGCDYTGWD